MIQRRHAHFTFSSSYSLIQRLLWGLNKFWVDKFWIRNRFLGQSFGHVFFYHVQCPILCFGHVIRRTSISKFKSTILFLGKNFCEGQLMQFFLKTIIMTFKLHLLCSLIIIADNLWSHFSTIFICFISHIRI